MFKEKKLNHIKVFCEINDSCKKVRKLVVLIVSYLRIDCKHKYNLFLKFLFCVIISLTNIDIPNINYLNIK